MMAHVSEQAIYRPDRGPYIDPQRWPNLAYTWPLCLHGPQIGQTGTLMGQCSYFSPDGPAQTGIGVPRQVCSVLGEQALVAAARSHTAAFIIKRQQELVPDTDHTLSCSSCRLVSQSYSMCMHGGGRCPPVGRAVPVSAPSVPLERGQHLLSSRAQSADEIPPPHPLLLRSAKHMCDSVAAPKCVQRTACTCKSDEKVHRQKCG